MDKEMLLNQWRIIFSDTFSLYLKTLNYHWHVSGENFFALHQLFEKQYLELAESIDVIAERIVTLGSHAPGTFSEIQKFSTLQEGDATSTTQRMIRELEEDHNTLVKHIKKAMEVAKDAHDEGSMTILSDLLASHEKNAWMLRTSEL